MPTPRTPDSTAAGQMLFLAGHGLQTPLSAIRWGCSRLGKTARKKMNAEECRLLDGIQHEARLLSGMLNALLLVAKTEEGTFSAREQDIYLRDFLTSFSPLRDLAGGKTPRIACPKDLRIRADRAVLETVFQAIVVILESSGPLTGGVRVKVDEKDGECFVHILPPIELSFLREVPLSVQLQDSPQLVGGAPGLMLSILMSLCGILRGGIDVAPEGKRTHVLTLRLPVHPGVAPASSLSF